MNCPYCGMPLGYNPRFCEACARPIPETTSPASSDPSAEIQNTKISILGKIRLRCPSCGRRDTAELIAKRLVNESSGVSYLRPAVNDLKRGRGAYRQAYHFATPTIFETYSYAYTCRSCGNEWSESKLEKKYVKK